MSRARLLDLTGLVAGLDGRNVIRDLAERSGGGGRGPGPALGGVDPGAGRAGPARGRSRFDLKSGGRIRILVANLHWMRWKSGGYFRRAAIRRGAGGWPVWRVRRRWLALPAALLWAADEYLDTAARWSPASWTCARRTSA